VARPAPTPSQVRHRVEPRDVPAGKAARRLHLTLVEFQEVLPALHSRGFPSPDPTTGFFDLKKIDLWMDTRNTSTDDARTRDAREVVNDRLARM
jgi:hypothetical protein